MNVIINIDRLILDGIDLPAHQRPLLQTAVEAELTRLIAAGGLGSGWKMGGAVPGLPANPIQLPAGNEPATLGRQIAQSVYGGLRS